MDGRANAFEARRHVERIGTVPFEDDGGQIEMMGDLTRRKHGHFLGVVRHAGFLLCFGIRHPDANRGGGRYAVGVPAKRNRWALRPPRTARHKAGRHAPATMLAIKKRHASVDGRWCAF
ncbi:hypothetical protein XHV734_1350 [Xanthomonas hortorum pv. vitians]|nr:hypothetical protein XHV734_1350 [Xanthomonas hortorum pv. vitians]